MVRETAHAGVSGEDRRGPTKQGMITYLILERACRVDILDVL